MQGDDTWRKLLNAGGSPAGGGAARPKLRSPQAASPHPAAGVQGLLSPILDDESLEGKIARVEKRLKKNLPAATRAEYEKELEALQVARREGKSAVSEPPGSSNIGEAADRQLRGARRKVGMDAPLQEDGVQEEAADLDDEEEELVKVTRKVNKAAPKVQHPQTIARMADWKGELQRRIQEQQDMDGRATTTPTAPAGIAGFSLPLLGGAGETDSPLGKVHSALDGWVGDVVNALGLGKQEPDETCTPPQPLPPQTFSRRL